MKRFLALALAAFCCATFASAADAPLRVYLRSGPKSQEPGAHEHPRFLSEWLALLNERGARAAGGDAFPTAAQLAQTDVVVLHLQEGGNVPAADRANLEAYLKRGGGLVVLHAGIVSRDPDWFKTIVGGSWRDGATRGLQAPMHLYLADREHPITRGASNWSMEDEIFYDLDLLPEVHVLAAAYTPKSRELGGRGDRAAQQRAAEAVAQRRGVNVYDIQPQLWTYERTVPGGAKPYRAFVAIPGHLYENFRRPNYRAILLRGIAWAGGRANADELCRAEELGDALRYPEGGPTAPAQAAAKIEVHPEFQLSLVAAEPLINKVMNVDWDEKGRLWVCETPEYPNGRRVPNSPPWKDSGSLRGAKVDRPAEDRISILTDTDGDGIMDRKQVFADGLELVTSFVFHKRGVIAAASPDIWYLEDTNGDDVADKRTKLYTGLGANDTHAVINNLRWGLDGWIYATHGYSRGDVTSPDGAKKFGPDGSGVVRFRPDGSAFEQYSSRSGNTWGLEITWGGEVFWTQPTSGTVLFHTVLPESVLAQGKLPGTNSWKGMISNQRTYPLMTWPEQAYVQIDQVGRFTAAAGCAVYEGGAWPEKWNASYFTGEATLNLVHHQFLRPDGVSYTTEKEKGREETEFIRSNDLWFRPIETRIGPDGALYVVDFYNQAVIHNDTRGPVHSPSNAAVRPDRDHYFARIWKVQHKQAKTLPAMALSRDDLPGLLRAIETSPNAQVKKTAWRLAQENHSGDPRLAALSRPMGGAILARYEAASKAATAEQRAAVLAEFAAAKDDWTRSALIAAATGQAAEYVAGALASPQAATLAAFASALLPGVSPSDAPRLLAAAATESALQAIVLRGLAALPSLPPLDPASREILQQLLGGPATGALALPLAAKWDAADALAAARTNAALRLQRELGAPGTPDARRAALVAGLLAIPAQRPETLARVGALLAEPGSSTGLKETLIATLAEAAGKDTADALVAVFLRDKSDGAFDAILRRAESVSALLAAFRVGRIASGDLTPGQQGRLRNHPDRALGRQAAGLLDAEGGGASRAEIVAKLLPALEKAGDVEKGKQLFAAACIVCHKLGGMGERDVGPPLTGIGSHPVAELAVHILDPNREVDPSFVQWNITTKKGESLAGVVTSENSISVTIRNQGGDTEVKIDDIARRENTRRSLMPEGFEGMGAEGVRDVIAFLRANATADARNVMGAVASGAGAAAAAPVDSRPKAGGPGDAPLPPVTPMQWEPGKKRVLIVSGGSSHNFTKFYDGTDRETLLAAGFTVCATQDRDQAAAELAHADVAVVSVNRRFFDSPEYRKALFDFVAAGKGLVLLHPGTWYGFTAWPEMNAQLVGGGARGHDRIAKFSINAVKPEHPIMQGVPPAFEIEDELYYMNAEPDKIPPGTAAIEVLAETSPSVRFQAPHPAVWVTKHAQARIVGITPGHDERTHDHPAFKKLLANAVKWCSEK
jgi:putative membrane-bound dehydrogenase-like protein